MQYYCQNYIIIAYIVVHFSAGFPCDKSENLVTSDKFNIQLVGCISKTEDIIQSESLISKFWDLLTGHENQELIKPFSLWLTRSDVMYVIDQGASKIQVYDPQNNSARHFHFPELISLIDITMLADSSIIFSDSRQNKVFRLYPHDDVPAIFITQHILNQPTGLVYNPATDDVWIVETAAHRISTFDSHGNFVMHVGARGTDAGQFNYPTFITVDRNQNFYVVDAMNHRIQIFNNQGDIISIFGQAGDGSGDLARPKGIACDSYGHIYIVDGLFHNVQIFDINGNYLAHFGRQGQAPGEFWMPAGIFIDYKNKIYVADTYNSRIQIFELEVSD